MHSPETHGPCPCCSGSLYGECCGPILGGDPASSPQALMRSRYAAYAVGAVDYLMGTTDPSGPQHRSPRATWRAELLEFCQQTHFSGLLLLGHGQDGERGWVRFRALLEQGGRDASFEEHSLFHRRDGRWLYHSGRPTAQSGGER